MQVKPVEPQHRRCHCEIRLLVADGREHSRQDEQAYQGRSHHASRWIDSRCSQPEKMQPDAEHQEYRQADQMQKCHQREESIGYQVVTEKVAGHGISENGDAIDQLGGTDGNILGELIPDQPIAGNAQRENYPDERHARDPAKPPAASIAVERKFF